MNEMTSAEVESISRVRNLLDHEASGCPNLADLWEGLSEDLRMLAAGEPIPAVID